MPAMLYTVLPASGGWVNGAAVAIGAEVALSPQEALYEVDLGHVAPTGRPPVPPDPPVFQTGDLVLTRRGAQVRDITLATFEEFLLRDGGTISTRLAAAIAAYDPALAEKVTAFADFLVDGAPSDRNTLGKLATALAALALRVDGKAGPDDVTQAVAGLATTLSGQLAGKIDRTVPTFASSAAAVAATPSGAFTVARVAGVLSLWINDAGTLRDFRAGLVTATDLDV